VLPCVKSTGLTLSQLKSLWIFYSFYNIYVKITSKNKQNMCKTLEMNWNQQEKTERDFNSGHGVNEERPNPKKIQQQTHSVCSCVHRQMMLTNPEEARKQPQMY